MTKDISGLISERAELRRQARIIGDQKAELSRKLRGIQDRMSELSQIIEGHNGEAVTDHALVRYLERVEGFDVMAARRSAVTYSKTHPDKVHIDRGKIVTVVGPGQELKSERYSHNQKGK